MINFDVLTAYIQQALPGANVSVSDRTGTMDHLSVRVISDLFQGKNLLDRHRMIYQALDEPMSTILTASIRTRGGSAWKSAGSSPLDTARQKARSA